MRHPNLKAPVHFSEIPCTCTDAPVTSRISLIFEPPLPKHNSVKLMVYLQWNPVFLILPTTPPPSPSLPVSNIYLFRSPSYLVRTDIVMKTVTSVHTLLINTIYRSLSTQVCQGIVFRKRTVRYGQPFLKATWFRIKMFCFFWIPTFVDLSRFNLGITSHLEQINSFNRILIKS